ncbi:MAG TPA: ATP-binding cassette domain-containing protein [Haloplasmataceae bacterium]
MLRIRSLKKVFKQEHFEQTVFDNFSLNVNEGDFITIIGSNGAGKSTLLHLIMGNLFPDEGEILYRGEPIEHLPSYKRSAFISYVYQDPSVGVAPNLTILENLSMVWNKYHRNPFRSGIRRREIELLKEKLALCQLGLENMLDKKVKTLSGGQRQAVSLIMSILHKPDILLLDEHTGALDPATADKILSITRHLVDSYHVTTLMVTHNMQQALENGNRLLMLDQGTIILDVKGEEKARLTPEDLIERFKQLKYQSISDRLVLN